MTDNEFFRDLAERLRSIPVMYGTNDGDIDQLLAMASERKKTFFTCKILQHPNQFLNY